MNNIQPIYEKQFRKEARFNQDGFIVGEYNENLINQFELINHANWQAAIVANKLRARYDILESYINSCGQLKPSLKEKIRFAVDELIMNSEIHGDGTSEILLCIHRTSDGLWINCRDKGGNFSHEAAQSLYLSIFEEKLTPSLDGPGAGIGLGMITKMSSQIHIRCQKNKNTIVSAFIPDIMPSGLKSFSFIIFE
jgi:anti-sigma regulatory factor (Ser/Thr protein kinase)